MKRLWSKKKLLIGSVVVVMALLVVGIAVPALAASAHNPLNITSPLTAQGHNNNCYSGHCNGYIGDGYGFGYGPGMMGSGVISGWGCYYNNVTPPPA